MIIPKDLDKRADKVIADLEAYGNMTSEDKLIHIKEEIKQDYEQVKNHCSIQYTQKVTKILLLVDRLIRNL